MILSYKYRKDNMAAISWLDRHPSNKFKTRSYYIFTLFSRGLNLALIAILIKSASITLNYNTVYAHSELKRVS